MQKLRRLLFTKYVRLSFSFRLTFQLALQAPGFLHNLSDEDCWELIAEFRSSGIINKPEVLTAALKVEGEGISRRAKDAVDLQSCDQTTLAIRNIPAGFSQQKLKDWMDSIGFENTYDFLLWFPPKSATPVDSCSYAFVNFVDIRNAHTFRNRFHLKSLDEAREDSCLLSVVSARVQGFAKNYTKFGHLLDKSSAGVTRCEPFFSRRPEKQVSETGSTEGVHTTQKYFLALKNSTTTLVIRNFPLTVTDQESARTLLDTQGFKGTYDFFLYIPAKMRRPSGPFTFPYVFVNFIEPDHAFVFSDKFNGVSVVEDGPQFNIVASKVQGLQECIKHFQSMHTNNRCKPFIAREPEPTRFQ